jgi:hypothetical protein
MRPLYLFLKITLQFALRVFFSKIRFVNAPKKIKNRTIYISNHPSGFMDPLMIAVLQRPKVFFMTRSDLFTKVTRPLLWACQMLPIYRSTDDDVKKNDAVFEECFRLLKRKDGLLLFGEGISDERFVRRIKPLKKGAGRIAFGFMEKFNWELDLNIVCVGLNYEDPTRMRSQAVIVNSDPIPMSDFKELHDENPATALNELMKEVNVRLRKLATDVKDKTLLEMHEQVMQITRKGMNVDNHDPKLSLVDRQQYSNQLGDFFNDLPEEKTEGFTKLQDKLKSYFQLLKRSKLEEKYISEKQEKGKLAVGMNLFHLILGLPIFILGVIHMGPVYLLVKKLVEGGMKRRVFWSSVKVAMGMILHGLYNLVFIWAFYYLVYPSVWLGILYFFTIPGLTFIYAYFYRGQFFDWQKRKKIGKANIEPFMKRRTELVELIKKEIPVA